MEDTRPVWNYKCLIFQILNPSENRAIDKIIVSSKGRVIFKQYIPKTWKCFGNKIFKLCSLTGYTYGMEMYMGKDRQHTAQHSTARDSNTCDSDRPNEERRMWLQIIHWQFLFFPWIIWCLGEETVLLLWYCEAEQRRHAARISTKDIKTEKGRYSHKNQGWLDGSTVAGQERHLHVNEYSWCSSGR